MSRLAAWVSSHSAEVRGAGNLGPLLRCSSVGGCNRLEAAVVTDLVAEKGKESVVSACACPCVPTFEALIGPVAPCSLQLALTVSQLNVVVMTTAGHVTRQPIRVLEDGSLNTAWCIRTLTADPNLSLC